MNDDDARSGARPKPRSSRSAKDAVLHARIFIGDMELMAADIPNAEPMRRAYLTLRTDSDVEAQRIY